MAYSHCKANDIDVSPEIDTGNGKIDFKFSAGFKARVLVEIKLSRNPKLVDGFTKQLADYKTSQQTMRAFYVVIDVGGMGKKDKKLIAEINDAKKHNEPVSELCFINGELPTPPSKLK